MKAFRAYLSLLLMGPLLPTAVAGVPAQDSGILVPIVELTDEDVARLDLYDGSTADWVALVSPSPTLTVQDFVGISNGAFLPIDVLSLTFGIWLGWHDGTDRIYGAIERVDDVGIPQQEFNPTFRDLGIYYRQQDSGLNLMVCAEGRPFDLSWWAASGLTETRDEARARRDVANRETQYFSIYGHLEGTWRPVSLEQNNTVVYDRSWFVEPPYADAGGGHFSEQPVVTVEEFYVTPFDPLVWNDQAATVLSDLRTGGRIHFALGVWDKDTPFGTGALHRFSDADYLFPYVTGQRISDDYYAVGLLLGKEDIARDEQAEFASETWAGIKAATLGRPAARRDP